MLEQVHEVRAHARVVAEGREAIDRLSARAPGQALEQHRQIVRVIELGAREVVDLIAARATRGHGLDVRARGPGQQLDQGRHARAPGSPPELDEFGEGAHELDCASSACIAAELF